MNQTAFTAIDTNTYDDLVKRANLADLLADRIITLEQQNKAILERLDKAEFELSGKDGSVTGSYELAMAQLNRRLAKLENPPREIGQTAKERANRIDKYMAARPDHKASYEALKGFLGIDSALLNQAIAALMKEQPGKYATTKDKTKGRGRNKWLVEVPQMA